MTSTEVPAPVAVQVKVMVGAVGSSTAPRASKPRGTTVGGLPSSVANAHAASSSSPSSGMQKTNETIPLGSNGRDKGVDTRSTSRLCNQCDRRAPCNLHNQLQTELAPLPSGVVSTSASASTSATATASSSAAASTSRPRRISKLKHRALNSTSSADLPAKSSLPRPRHAAATVTPVTSPERPRTSTKKTSSRQPMEPPVLSFYGTEPVPLQHRFGSLKRSLVAGHEAELEASWTRLLAALREEVAHIESLGPSLTPSIEFSDIKDPQHAGPFAAALRRYGVGVVRGTMPRADTQRAIDETIKYLETKHDFKAPPAQDPTCFDFFWSPAQVQVRAHPHVLQAQRFAMGLWDHHEDDRMAIQFPITYADRIRIHGASVGGPVLDDDKKGEPKAAKTALDTAQEARKAAVELLGDFSSSTVIAQVDNGSLERWERDGYGRGGTYDAVFRGEWEKYDAWDPTYRVTATPDLYNGYGACSIFRMYQGILALSTIEPGMVRLLPSPKLATAYFLLRPFFSPKSKPPEQREGPEWDKFLDASNWALDKEQNTIIHGAVPGHAQRLTELWHPHLHLRRSLVTLPTLRPGDYILWHPDLAYHFSSNGNGFGHSRAATPPPESAPQVSMLVYVPACPLTQTNALYLARQRKTFQRGHPGPDFDSTGSGLGSEAYHSGRPGEKEIEEAGGVAGLQAMGFAPFDVAATPSAPSPAGSAAEETRADDDVAMTDADDADAETAARVAAVEDRDRAPSPRSDTATEVARLANIILFPDRYDFYMAGKKTGTNTPRVAEKDKEKMVIKEEKSDSP